MRRLISLTVTVTCALATACPAGFAASAAPPFGYAVSAVGFDSYFVFKARPGATVGGRLRVVNLTARPKTLLVAPADVSTAAAGGLQYGDSAPDHEGRWLKLAVHSVRLAGNESTTVPFTVAIPARARPGDHFLGIIVLDKRVLGRPAVGHGPIRLHVIPRLAMTVQLQLPGRSTRRLALGRINISVAPSGASLALRVSNPANTLIGMTTGRLTVSQGRTELFGNDIELAAFVPETAITYHLPWSGTPVEGTYRVTGELRPNRAPPIAFDRTVTFGDRAIRQYRRQTGRSAIESSGIPVSVVVGLVLAVATALAFAVAYARLRRRLRGRP